MFLRIFCVLVLSFVVACGGQKGSDIKPGKGGSDGGSQSSEGTSSASFESVKSLSDKDFVPDRVFFDFDSADISETYKNDLKKQYSYIKETSKSGSSVVIEGSCDERGGVEYNFALGEKRASAVRDFLVKLGLESSKVKVVSFGKERKIVNGDSPEAYAQNRAAITVIKK